MVDGSILTFGLWTGRKNGGTYDCIRKAIKKKREVWILHPFDLAKGYNLYSKYGRIVEKGMEVI